MGTLSAGGNYYTVLSATPVTFAITKATVTVTPKEGQPVSGVLLQLDDFNVSLRDASGWYRTFARTPDVKVTVTDPLAAHRALLETITDKNMHDVVAYLETLK